MFSGILSPSQLFNYLTLFPLIDQRSLIDNGLKCVKTKNKNQKTNFHSYKIHKTITK